MEEQKTKEVKMNVANDKDSQDNIQPQKYTYEQLNDICNRLFQENQQLKHQIQQANKFLQTVNRLDYLFKVVEIQNASKAGMPFPDEFYYNCIKEIQEIMTIPEEVQESDKEN
jgi:hypothetical protein